MNIKQTLPGRTSPDIAPRIIIHTEDRRALSYANQTRHTYDKRDALTPQEINISLLVADGLTNSDIASKLYLSPGTVRNYVSSILAKLQLTNRAALAVYVVSNDLRGQAVETYTTPVVAYDPDCYKELVFLAFA